MNICKTNTSLLLGLFLLPFSMSANVSSDPEISCFCAANEAAYLNYKYLVANTLKICLNDQQKSTLKQYFDGQRNKYKQHAELLKESVWAKSSIIGFGILLEQLGLVATLLQHDLVDEKNLSSVDVYLLMLAGQEFIERMQQANPELQKLVEEHIDSADCRKLYDYFFKAHMKFSVFQVYYVLRRANSDENFCLIFQKILNKELVNFADYLSKQLHIGKSFICGDNL